MKIALLSDIHLEFGKAVIVNNTEKSEVLVLAGDICMASQFPKNDAFARKHNKRVRKFFDSVSSQFEVVFWVMGNHESYEGVIEYTAKNAKEFVEGYNNVYVLDNEVIGYRGVSFVGSTLWSYIDPRWALEIQRGMSDYRVIKSLYDPEQSGISSVLPLTCHQTTTMFYENVEFIGQAIKGEDNVVVITHHGPSYGSISPRFQTSILNSAFCSDLSGLIQDNPQIKYWVHGHTHDPLEYEVGETTVVAAPHGYPFEFGELKSGASLKYLEV